MGRNLFRRTALILLLLEQVSAAAFSSEPTETFLPPRQGAAENMTNVSGFTLKGSGISPPRQNQSAPKAWSVNPALFKDRPEVNFWISRWNSPEGRKKLRAAERRFFPFRLTVDRVVRSSGIPWEILAIPVVESNWRVNAVSSSGAAGPWQFLESSARGRRLIIDAWRDERRDVELSTRAAVSELKFYYRLFSDWLLCCAAYNGGPTRLRQLREQGSYSGFWDMLDDGILPRETGNYVPQIIAVAWVSAHAGRLGLPLNWEMPPRWSSIPLERSIHLNSLAEFLDISVSAVESMNRELNHPVTPPPQSPYSIKVPADTEEKVRKWLKEQKSDAIPERFWRYTVRSGDTLSEIAERTGISLGELLQYNGHVLRGTLRVGERLYLPGDASEPPGAEADALPRWTGKHTVQPGESLWSIARAYSVTPEILAEVNHRRLNQVLRAGSILKVPRIQEALQ